MTIIRREAGGYSLCF